MSKLYVSMTLLAGASMWLPTAAFSQDANSGKIEYEANCAVCHGEAGTGAGPFADYIKTAVPDLTMLAKNNGGVFPAERVHEVVDGRREVAIHGPRNMPIWGREYNDQAAEYYREVWKVQDAESIVRNRIDGLVAYLESLQQ